jgi:hypothetical protein
METEGDQWGQLMANLHGLVDAGLLVEIREPGEPSRYALHSSAAPSGSASPPEAHVHPLPVWPEPCPVCGASDGFDGGGRCLACYVPWPPEM